MKPPVETVRVSRRGKEILIKLKRYTAIEQWNVLCRWALCASLMRDSVPPKLGRLEESNVEMTWKTFAGSQADLLCGLVTLKALKHGIDVKNEASLGYYFRCHLERGISNIQGVKGIQNLLIERGY